MPDKKIEIQIASTGGDQAAAEVLKVAAAEKATQAAEEERARKQEEWIQKAQAAAAARDDGGSTGFGGMLDKQPAQAREASEATRDLADANKSLASQIEEVNDRLDERHKAINKDIEDLERDAEKARKTKDREDESAAAKKELAFKGLAAAAIGAAAKIALSSFEDIAKGIQSIDTEKLKEISPEIAKQAEDAKSLADTLTHPIDAIQKWLSGSSIGDGFGGLNEQLERDAKQRAEVIDRIIHKGEDQVEEIKKLGAELRAANALLDATAAANAVERDNKDAAAIRGGAAPEDVRSQRAKDDSKEQIAKIDRELAEKRAGVQESFDLAKQGRINVEDVKRKGDTPEQVKQAQDLADKYQKDFEERQAAAKQAEAIAEQQRRAVRARADGTVDDAAGDKADRLKREKEKAAADEQREKEKALKEQQRIERERAEAEREKAKRNLEETEGTNGGRVAASAGRANNKQAADLLKKIGGDLGKADTEAEIRALGEKIHAAQNQLGDKVVTALLKLLEAQESLVKRINTLDGQLKNLRTGR